MDWDKLRVFHAVAEAGSFTHAGDTLNLSQSAVSRQISALEEALQVPLFHRHARGLILTEQGESLNRTVREESGAWLLLKKAAVLARPTASSSAATTWPRFPMDVVGAPAVLNTARIFPARSATATTIGWFTEITAF